MYAKGVPYLQHVLFINCIEEFCDLVLLIKKGRFDRNEKVLSIKSVLQMQ